MVKRVLSLGRSEVVFWIGVVGGLASILSFVCGLFVPGGDWKTRYIAISSTVYIVTLLFICAYVVWDRGKVVADRAVDLAKIATERDSAVQLAKYAKIFRPLHGICHKLRDALVSLQKSPPQPGEAYDESLCRAILDVFRELFQTTKGAEFSACIKTFDGNEENLRTICRDSVNEAHRGSEDSKRPCTISGNSDFKDILTGRRTFFCCNDLVKAAEAGDYFNDNPRWRDRYRSTIVWPIRCMAHELGRHELFGFLCIDTMATGLFDEDADVHLGACVADMIYAYFSRIDAVNRQDSPA